MNQVGAGTLSALELADLTVDLRAVVTDTDTSAETTFATPSSGGTFDPASGAAGRGESVDTVRTTYRALTAREVAADPRYRSSDRAFLVMAADLTVPPTTDTRITTGGQVWQAVAIMSDALGLHFEVVARTEEHPNG